MITLNVKGLCVNIGDAEILRGIDFRLNESVSIGIVGESGSGKTMFARSLTGLLPLAAHAVGDYEIDGSSFNFNAREREWRRVRGSEIGMIMQDPFTALEPLTKCGAQILVGVPKERRSDFDVKAALAEVGLRAEIAERYPFELSGGMRQRVVIAAALATEPKLLIADEATTALDVITQKEILDLIDEIRARRSMPLMIITHDIRLVYERTDRVLVMEKGRIVETGQTRSVIGNPKEAYTKMLVEADRSLNISAYPEYSDDQEIILEACSVTKRFGTHTALSDVSIYVRAGECVGIVGESGSGKTTLARCITGLTHPDSGEIKYYGKVNPQIVFQDPYSSLNPAHTVKYILEEALGASGRPLSELDELLRLSEIPDELLNRRPASLSGGQRQRVAIARALAPGPELLICDESVSALDIVIQNQILGTIEKLRAERGLAVLFITHDLSVVRMLASRIYVLHDAEVVNEGTTEQIFEGADDSYTRQLIAASAVDPAANSEPVTASTSVAAAAPSSTKTSVSAAAVAPLSSVVSVPVSPATSSPVMPARMMSAASELAPTLYYNGRIYTVSGADWEKTPKDAMAVGDDGRILYVGAEDEARSVLIGYAAHAAGYNIVDLEGSAVLPGFIDTHVHMPGSALTELFEIYMYDCRDINETLEKIRFFIAGHRDFEAYFGTGFYMSILSECKSQPRELLDAIEPVKPVILNSSDGHSHWLNTVALKALGITAETHAPDGGIIQKDSATGKPSGIVSDAHQLITLEPQYDEKQCEQAVRLYQKRQIGWGYTSAMHIAPHFCSLDALKTLVDSGQWYMRVNLSARADQDTPLTETFADLDTMHRDFDESLLIKTTAVKFFEDGVVEGRTAYLKEPYPTCDEVSDGYCSEPLWNIDKLSEAFTAVTGAGYQIHVHAIGDAAVHETLTALAHSRAVASVPMGHRDVLTHLQLVSEDDIDIMRDMQVIASHQPFWHFREPGWYDEIDEHILGAERANLAYPVGSMVRRGVTVTFSGDYPASPVNDPFWAIQIAVTRNLSDPDHYGVDRIESQDDTKWLRNAGERISIKEAIEAYTINGAFQLFREDETGSLEKGKFADFIVLTDDPFSVRTVELFGIKVKNTYIGGKLIKIL